MGYQHYTLPDGREAGYGVEATCDKPGCREQIDRGLAYLCGDAVGDGGEHGCGRYFCGRHLYTPLIDEPQIEGSLCEQCLSAVEGNRSDPSLATGRG